MAECRGLAPLARRHALVSTETRFACPVGIPESGRRGETCTPMAVRGWAEPVCYSRLTTRRSAPRDLHPEGSAILSRWGLLFPLRPGAVKLACRGEVRSEVSGPPTPQKQASARQSSFSAGLRTKTGGHE